MQQRVSGNRRPSGTDGSDFSYRMVVDNRYTKVAKGKSTLSKILLIQAGILLLGVLGNFLAVLKNEPLDKLSASFCAITCISIVIGELGRKHSRVNLLKFYMTASSLGMLVSIACIVQSNIQPKIIQGLSNWETKKHELLRIAGVSVGLLVQIFSVTTTMSLVQNMSPPKRAS